MSWTFLHNAPDKRQVIETCTKSSDTLKCITKSVHGNHLWTIWQDLVTNHMTIILFLLGKDRGNWGYKDITEYQGPVDVDCPLAFLDAVPEPVADSGWRNKVRAYHEKEKVRRTALKEIEVGKMVRLNDSKPNEFLISSLNPLQGVASDGCVYKIPKTRIKEVL